MAGVKLSRRNIATYIAGEIIVGRDVVVPLAAYLIDSRRIRETALIVRDIEAVLASHGILFADVLTSHGLTQDTKRDVAQYLKDMTKATDVYLREEVDKNLLGGVRIETPDQRFDTTLRHRLNQLTATKL